MATRPFTLTPEQEIQLRKIKKHLNPTCSKCGRRFGIECTRYTPRTTTDKRVVKMFGEAFVPYTMCGRCRRDYLKQAAKKRPKPKTGWKQPFIINPRKACQPKPKS